MPLYAGHCSHVQPAAVCLLLQGDDFQDLYAAFRAATRVTEEDLESFAVGHAAMVPAAGAAMQRVASCKYAAQFFVMPAQQADQASPAKKSRGWHDPSSTQVHLLISWDVAVSCRWQ
jgi:hypothetical protein